MANDTTQVGNVARLSDAEVLEQLRVLDGKQRAVQAISLEHLAEVDARRPHLRLGYSSLFEYSLRELHLSEDEAYRRIVVARLGRRWPEILAGIARGELHLSGVALLRPYLSDDNVAELLGLARHSSKRELAGRLAERFPSSDVSDSLRKLPSRTERVSPLSAARFRLQLTIGVETRAKLERARDLLAHANPSRSLEPLIDRALDSLLATLEREKRAQLKGPRRAAAPTPKPARPKPTRPTSPWTQTEIPGAGLGLASPVPPPSRAIPRPIRRAVFERDGAVCGFVGVGGHTCGSTALLELDHREPWALGGPNSAANLRVLCRAHNQLAAEDWFGRFAARRASAESRATHTLWPRATK